MSASHDSPARLHEACRALWDEAARFDVDGADPAAMCAPLARFGLFANADAAWEAPALCEALMAIGAASLPAARIFEGHANALLLVRRHASSAQSEALSRKVAAGAVCGVWNAETPPGLRLDGGRLGGGKIYASGIGLVTQPLVTARTADGAVVMLLPGEAPAHDLAGWTARGMRATATGTVDYTGVEVGAEAVVGAPGDYYRAPGFKGGAWRFAAAQAGAVLRIQALVSEGLAARGRDADPVQRTRVARLAVAAHTAQAWCRQAAAMEAGAEADPAAFEAFVGLTRTAVFDAAEAAIGLAERSLGLSAFLRPNPLDRVIRDLSAYLRQPFPDAVVDEAAAFVGGRGGVPPWSALAEARP